MKKTKIFFILDKYCAANPEYGISEWETNIWKSFQSTNLGEFELFHFDEYFEKKLNNADEALLERISIFKPNFICLVIYRLPGTHFSVPTMETLRIITEDFRLPIIAIWGDLEHKEQVDISKKISKFVIYNYATASSAAIKRINDPLKYFYIWVPKNPFFFNSQGSIKDIDVCYFGSAKDDRIKVINYLIENGIKVSSGGGEREEHLTTEQYANKFKSSKIVISFSRAAYSHVINARPFEAMLCGAMVLEQENFETPKLFTPFVDYVPYNSKKDLLKKIKYYLNNEKELRSIAKNGENKSSKFYSALNFWNSIIIHQDTGKFNNLEIINLEYSNLKRLSFLRRLKIVLLDIVCSSKLGFYIYLRAKLYPELMSYVFRQMKIRAKIYTKRVLIFFKILN